MPFQVVVQLKNGTSEIYSAEYSSREEAEGEIAKIKAKISGVGTPDVTWMAAGGQNILSAHIIEVGGF